MKKLLAGSVVLVFLSGVSQPDACDFAFSLDGDQIRNAQIAYKVGKPYNLGHTMVAIAWQESRLGKYSLRVGDKIQDVSFGVFQKSLYWDTKELSGMERGEIAKKLLTDTEYAANMAIKDLQLWLKVHKTWEGMVQGYNAGYGSNSKYVESVTSTYHLAKQCNWEE